MSASTLRGPVPASVTHRLGGMDRLRNDPAYQAFTIRWIGFSVAPILFGIDKFFNVMVNCEQYLAPWIRDLSPLSASGTMHVVGVIEIVAGIAIATMPRFGAYLGQRGWSASWSTSSPIRATTTSPCGTSA